MSIIGYAGLPGSGKSYGVVENVVLPALKAGRAIVTNLVLNMDKIKEDFPDCKIEYFETANVNNEYFDMTIRGAGAIWIVDEAHKIWPAGVKISQVPDNVKAFFTEHRHFVGDDGLTSEIVIITQNFAQIATFIRNLIEESYISVKHSKLGLNKSYRVDIHIGAPTGNKLPEPLRSGHGKYKESVYQYYSSHTQNNTSYTSGLEVKADGRAVIWKSKFLWVSVVFLAVVSWWSVGTVSHYFDPARITGESENNSAPIPASGNVKNNVQNERLDVKYDVPEWQFNSEIEKGWLPVSEVWRITGVYDWGYKKLVQIDSERGSRMIPFRLCRYAPNTGETVCVINGVLVTEYSSVDPALTDSTEREYVNINDS